MAVLSRLFCSVSRMMRAVLHLLLPPLCLVCDAPVASDDALCAACWKKMAFIAPPCCARCGLPFDLPVDDGTLCGACLAAPPVFDRARSALVYDAASRALILRFKHADRTHAAGGMATAMLRAAGPQMLEGVDVIVPVPLHRWRLLARRYNQAALLATALGKRLNKPVDPFSLCRVRSTPPQGHLDPKARAANVKGAFAMVAKREKALEGQSVLLIDDVFTTGATLNEAAQTLKAAGAKNVVVLTFARVKKAD